MEIGRRFCYGVQKRQKFYECLKKCNFWQEKNIFLEINIENSIFKEHSTRSTCVVVRWAFAVWMQKGWLWRTPIWACSQSTLMTTKVWGHGPFSGSKMVRILSKDPKGQFFNLTRSGKGPDSGPLSSPFSKNLFHFPRFFEFFGPILVYKLFLHFSEPIKRVFSPDSKPGGVRPMFMNDLDVSSDGKAVYFSDSSAKWDRAHFLHAFLEQKPDGRWLKFIINSKKT